MLRQLFLKFFAKEWGTLRKKRMVAKKSLERKKSSGATGKSKNRKENVAIPY